MNQDKVYFYHTRFIKKRMTFCGILSDDRKTVSVGVAKLHKADNGKFTRKQGREIAYKNLMENKPIMVVEVEEDKPRRTFIDKVKEYSGDGQYNIEVVKDQNGEDYVNSITLSGKKYSANEFIMLGQIYAYLREVIGFGQEDDDEFEDEFDEFDDDDVAGGFINIGI